MRINVDRLKASELGVSVNDVSQTLQLALSNRRMGYFTKEGKQYQVMGQVDPANRDDPNDLKGRYVRNATGQMISLDNLATFQEAPSPATIYPLNR